MRAGESGDELVAAAADGVATLFGIPVPGLGLVAGRLSRAVRLEHERRQSVALAAAERISGRTREELAEEIAADPALHPLVARVLYAAGVNGYDRILRAMGSALGEVTADREKTGEVELLLQSLGDVSREHVELLELIDRAPSSWAPEDVDEASSLTPVAQRLCRAALVARGLTVEVSGVKRAMFMPPPSIRLSPAGATLLAVLEEYDAEVG